ncbi:MAG: hypothetical protein KBD56_03780 [Candidatus Eisenbacteria bacterium]|nr:hypothetical protein [Candidatus Eisenbacteria bacterium]
MPEVSGADREKDHPGNAHAMNSEKHDSADEPWRRHPQAEAFCQQRLEECRAAIPPFATIAREISSRTGTRVFDWIDHFALADGRGVRKELAAVGYAPDPASDADGTWIHPGAILPRIALQGAEAEEGGGALRGVGLAAERLADFLAAWRIDSPVEGSPLAPLRRARIWSGDRIELAVIERTTSRGIAPREVSPARTAAHLAAFERWRTRARRAPEPGVEGARAAMQATLRLARSLAEELGPDEAAWTAFAAERDYWQARNRAGRAQRACQDALGLGWANHDHHTFRSSRELFPLLLETLQAFGFHARERFHAGAQAGWGAQVLEQPACRLAVFADVDLSPEEIAIDFRAAELAPRETLGTVGLWCALHGESLLDAGLHHLAVRADFSAFTRGLAGFGVSMMSPFSDFSFLKQAFTAGERWVVDPLRVERLPLTEGERARFAAQGAIGSHLENIQRGEGFKGFNQTAVSDIIRRTDPRERGA